MITTAEAISLVQLAERKFNESLECLRSVRCQAPLESYVRQVLFADVQSMCEARPRFFWLRMFLDQHGWDSAEKQHAKDELAETKGAFEA